MLRLARNWVLFLACCAAVVALLTGGILWLLPKAVSYTHLDVYKRQVPTQPVVPTDTSALDTE